MSSLTESFNFYLANQADFVQRHNGKVIVIKDNQVIGVFDDEITAVNETQKKHEIGTFLVQKVGPGSDLYTQTFHSRVAFG